MGDDENVYMLSMGKKTVCSSVIIESVEAELAVLQEVAELSEEALIKTLSESARAFSKSVKIEK